MLKNIIKRNSILSIFFDYFSSMYGFNLEKEYKLINLIKKKSPVVIDIGGNKGESIKNFLKYNKNLKIYCFEPKKKSFEIIKKKFNNKNIKIFNCGIGCKFKKIELYTPTIFSYEFSSLSSTNILDLKFRLKAFFNKIYKNFSFVSEIINIKKLDNFFLKPDLIKIDTEGSELDIIKSSIKTIKKYNPILIIEFNHKNFDKLKRVLLSLGYNSYLYQSKHFLKLNNKIIKKIRLRSNATNIVFKKDAEKFKYFSNIKN
jgi:FkbM family methyltransferase